MSEHAKHRMTVTGGSQQVTRDLEYWSPSMAQFRSYCKASKLDPDAILLDSLRASIKHRAINARAAEVRAALADGKSPKSAIATWIKAAHDYRPGQPRSRGQVTQKQAQAVMLKLAATDPDKYAELMASVK